MNKTERSTAAALAVSAVSAALLSACTASGGGWPQSMPAQTQNMPAQTQNMPAQMARAETVYAVTEAGHLLRFNAGTPSKIDARMTISGGKSGERILGIDFRPANGGLYAIGSSGQLYTLDVATARLTAVGSGGFGQLASGDVGFDFNPVVDRIRLVNTEGVNARLHPDTGMVVDADANMAGQQLDGALAYAPSAGSGAAARVVAAAYSDSRSGAKSTTNFAIDAGRAALVTQGSRAGSMPAVSPNSGQLFMVGPLGMAVSGPVSFDIAPATGTAFASFGSWFTMIDLATGAATRIGQIGQAEMARAIAIAP